MRDPDRLPRRLALALGLALALSALSGLLILSGDDGRDADPPQRFVAGEIAIDRRGDVITLTGRVHERAAADQLIDSLAARGDVAAVISRLEIDVDAPPPMTETIHRGLDGRFGARTPPAPD